MADLDALRAAYRGSQSGSEADHLSVDQWERLACDELGADERQVALDHILGCTPCSDTYRALQIVRSGAAEFDDAAPAGPEAATVRRFPWRGLGYFAMAATVVLAVVLPMRPAKEPVVDRGNVVVRSAGEEIPITPVSPLGTVVWESSADVVFEWTADGSPSPVFVEILDADGEPIWTGPETTSLDVVWPAAEIPGPGRYYWQVLVRDRHARTVDSELVAFDLVSANPP